MNITTISKKRYMNYEHYIKQLMQMVELNLSMMISKNPRLIKALDRSINHPLIRKYSNIPFNVQLMYVLNITGDYNSFTNCTNNDNEDNNIIVHHLLLSIPRSILLLSVIILSIWTMIEPLRNG